MEQHVSRSKSGMNSDIQRLITKTRRAKKLTQRLVAERLGISFMTYRRVEAGQTSLSLPQLQELAAMLDISPRILGLTDPVPALGLTESIPMLWALFCAGRSDLLRAHVPHIQAQLSQVNNPVSTAVARGYQILIPLTRDVGKLTEAQQFADMAVQLARMLPHVDELASALIARSRIPLDAMAYVTDQAMIDQLLTQARNDAEEALSISHQCRTIIRGIALINSAEIRARSRMPSNNVQPLLNEALTLAANYGGTDELGYILNPAGVLHLRARTGWYGALDPRDALDDIRTAMKLSQGGSTARWMVDMRITQAGLLQQFTPYALTQAEIESLVEQVGKLDAARLKSRLKSVIMGDTDTERRNAMLAMLAKKTR